jgi:hypothetical protein
MNAEAFFEKKLESSSWEGFMEKNVPALSEDWLSVVLAFLLILLATLGIISITF